MPKVPIDYSKTIIYKIEHINDENLVYVGFTTNWDRRKCEHKRNCNNETNTKHNMKLYQMIRENGGWEMFRMIEVEKFPCYDKREAEKRETEIMKELKANMNAMKSYVSYEEKKETRKEYIKINKDSIKERYDIYNKEYYETNQDRIKDEGKKYRVKNVDKITEYQKNYQEIHKDERKLYYKDYYENNKNNFKVQSKQYRELNKETKKEYDEKYREANKEKIKERKRMMYQKKIEELKKTTQ